MNWGKGVTLCYERGRGREAPGWMMPGAKIIRMKGLCGWKELQEETGTVETLLIK